MKILCTLGPSTFNEESLKRLESSGVNLFRINLSHTKYEDLEKLITLIKQHSKVPICLDTEGAQIRTGMMKEAPIILESNDKVFIPHLEVLGTNKSFNLTPLGITEKFDIGDFVSIDFNAVLAQVIDKRIDGIILKIINGGAVGSNKAVNLERDIELDSITTKDRQCLKLGQKYDIKHVALSFASGSKEVDEVRSLCLPGTFIISKIESRKGIKGLTGIVNSTDAILIDRGDLSREVPLEQVPLWQKHIISEAKSQKKEVYVATNLLESMINTSTPTRAEINDIFNTLNDGADGLVLAAETAIGKYPLACVSMIKRMIYVFNCQKNPHYLNLNSSPEYPQLITPHGGTLVDQMFDKSADQLLSVLFQLKSSESVLMDAELIANGTYSPIHSFMDESQLNSVLDKYKTNDGIAWTMPILLQVSKDQANQLPAQGQILLVNSEGKIHSLVEISSKFSIDLKDVAKKWFGTDSSDHPGVASFYSKGDVCISGKVFLVNSLESPHKQHILSPKQLRFIFAKKDWSTIVAFHSRNVIHSAHEYIQKSALTKVHADGVLISPVIGPKKVGDFTSNAIIETYELMINKNLLEKEKFLLSGFPTYSRYCGPREAVFTALCRQNMGCSHFIIGRDHTGVGQYYSPDANKKMFDIVEGIGIQPIFFDEISYNPEIGGYEPHQLNKNYLKISGTQVRESLKNNKRIPEWFMRKEVQDYLINKISNGEQIFIEG